MASFLRNKVSADSKDKTYRQGTLEGLPLEGEPDIMLKSVVYIKETGQIWTHGEFFGPAANMKVVLLTDEEWALLTDNDTDYSRLEHNTSYKVGTELLAPAPPQRDGMRFPLRFPIRFGGQSQTSGMTFPVRFPITFN